MRILILLTLFLTSNGYTSAQSPAVKKETTTVYKTKTGKKYHTKTCHYASASGTAVALEDAKKLGLTACSVCKPTTTVNSASKTTTPTRTSPTSTSRQCRGKTKAGARCKRITKSASGYCYQHG